MAFLAPFAAGIGAYVFVRYAMRSDKVKRDRWRDYGVEQFGLVGGNAGYDTVRHGYNVGNVGNVGNVRVADTGIAAVPSRRNYDEDDEEWMAADADADADWDMDSDFDDRDPFAPTNFINRIDYE